MPLLLGVAGATTLLINDHLGCLILGNNFSDNRSPRHHRCSKLQVVVTVAHHDDIRERYGTAGLALDLLNGNPAARGDAELLITAFNYCVGLIFSHNYIAALYGPEKSKRINLFEGPEHKPRKFRHAKIL